MSRCVCPLSGWFAAQANDSGHFPVVFSVHGADRDRPVQVPCGKCVGCLKDKAESWAVRCCHEAQLQERNCFATLTYRDPCPEKLDLGDVQRFLKRLRKRGVRVRYFLCGEYGSCTHRPHYHALFFGEDFRDGSVRSGMGDRSPNEYYVSPWLNRVWGFGHVTLAAVEPASVFYVTGYALKNLGDEDAFHVASRGIGRSWLDRYHEDISSNGFVTIDGVKHSVPPAYLARPERGFDFQDLKDARREYGRTLDPEVAWQRRCSASSREINLKAQAALQRGDPCEGSSRSFVLPTVGDLRQRKLSAATSLMRW